MSDQEKYENACLTGKLNIVQKLFKKVNVKHKKYTGFINACIGGHLDIVKYHVNNIEKLDINMYKSEPFVLACANYNINVAKYLLKLSEAKTLKIIKKGIPLFYAYPGIAFKKSSPNIFRWLLNKYGPYSKSKLINNIVLNELIINCAEGGHFIILRELIEKYNINIKNNQISGMTIIWASRNYRYKILKYLAKEYGKSLSWTYNNNLAMAHLLKESIQNTTSGNEKQGACDIIKMLLKYRIFTYKDLIPIIKRVNLDIDIIMNILKI